MENRAEIAFGILNTVIMRLYDAGELSAVELIQDKRDEESLKAMKRKEELKQERDKIYSAVEAIYSQGQRYGTPKQMIDEVSPLTTLAKVYFCLIANRERLKAFDKAGDLYDAVAYSYLYTFEGWREGTKLYKDGLNDFRSKLATLERCIRFIKADHPHIFNLSLIQKSAKDEREARDSYGMSAIGLEGENDED